MSTERELEFIDKHNFSQSYIVELNQKLTFCIHKIADKVEISDGDYDLLQALHKFYYNGEFMLFRTKVEMAEEKPVQNGLFDSVGANGAIMAQLDPHDDLAQ